MRVRRVVSLVSLGLIAGLGAGVAAASHFDASGRSRVRSVSFVHDRVRDRVREEGEARVIAVMGDAALPQTWARDWRERGDAIRELARRVKSDAPGFRVHREFEIFPFLAGTVDRQGMEELAASSYVEAIYPDRKHRAVLSESGPLIGQPYAEDTAGYDGTGIGIAIIDTGIDYTHADLGASATVDDFPNSKVVDGYNFLADDPYFPQYTDTSQYIDDEGHGTYVAGIAAGAGVTYRGIAPGANLLALKSLDDTGIGFSSNIIDAIEWCVTNKTTYNIKVINMSLGDIAEWSDPAECDADLEGQAVSEAVDNGIAVVAAAGNSGYTGGISIPACASDAIGVGASWDEGADVDTPAYFSNRGELIDVYAPGVWIISARLGGSYEEGAGTSAATPHVAGAIAVLAAEDGSAEPDALKARLKRTGVQIVDPTTDVATPRIDLERALTNEPASGPDLVVTLVTAGDSAGLVGGSIDLAISVENQGTEAADPCSAVIAISRNGIASPQDMVMATVEVPAIAMGSTWSSSGLTGTIPSTPPGDYSIVAFADSTYVVAEEDETNNGTLGTAFTVQALSSYVWANSIPSTMLKGETYQISVTMWNEGDAPWTSAGGYALGAASPEGTTRWGITTVALPVSTVGPGEIVAFTFSVTAPTEPGIYPCHWRMKRSSQYFGEIATGATKIRVYDEGVWGQGYPAIDGDRVAYEDYSIVSGYEAAVSVTNLATGARVVLPDHIGFARTWDEDYGMYMPPEPYKYFEISNHWFPDISGPWATWMVDDYTLVYEWYFQIVAQNVTNLGQTPIRVTYQSKDALSPSIDGNLVVWEDYRNDPDGIPGYNFLADDPDIYIADLSTASPPTDYYPDVYPLCTADGPQFAPRISGNLVVWEDWRDESEIQSDIYLYDLSVDSDGDGIPNWQEGVKPSPDPAEVQLTDTVWPEEFPDIDDRTVVWMDLRRGLGGTVDLYALDVDSPTAVVVAEDPAAFRYHPRIDGTNVTWEDWRQAQPDIYWADLTDGAGGPIAGSDAGEVWPDISGNRVVYSKHRQTRMNTDYYGNPLSWNVYNVWAQQMHPDGAVWIGTFTDLPAGFWAWEHIEAAAANGVVQGYPEGDYKPTVAVTRDQMAVYVARAMAEGDGNVPAGPLTPSFSDVAETGYGADGTDPYWAYKYIEYCADPARDVVQGYEDGTYRPLETVNRGQMAAYIGRALAGGDSFFDTYTPPSGPSFPDVPDTGYGDLGTDPYWAYKYVEYIADAGVTQGYLDGNYYPDVVVSRDQMAVYISRAFDYVD